MFRWVMLSLAVIVLAAVATVVSQMGTGDGASWSLPAGTDREGPMPKVAIEGSLTHEFGPMSTQKTGTHTWVIKNEGQGDLAIWLAGSNCMCTVAKLAKMRDSASESDSKEIVKPGESTEIEVEWKTKDAVGEFKKNVTIATNDPDRPEFLLNVHGQVHSPVVVLPEPTENVITVGQIANDSSTFFTLAVFSPERPDLKILKVAPSKADLIVPTIVPLTAEELAQLNTKGGYRVNFEIKPGMPLGAMREELLIETDHPDMPKLQYTLTGVTSGPINLMPGNIRIVALHKNDSASGQLNMLVREGRPTEFTVAQKPENVDVSITPNDTPTQKGRYRLTVTVPPGRASGMIDGEIILKTDHPKVGELKIPVNIVLGSG